MRLRNAPLAGLCGLSYVLLSSMAVAQSTQAQDGEFSVQRFEPAPGPRNFVTVEGARVDGKWAWSAGLFANYAYKPLIVKSCVSATDCRDSNATQRTDINVIRDMFTTDLLASLTPISRLQIGFRLPLTFVNGDGIDPKLGQASSGGLSGFGVGDPYLEGKFRFFGAPDSRVVAAAALFATAPVGHAAAKDKYIGNSSPVVGGRGIVDFRVGPLNIGGNIAAMYRGESSLGSATLGPEFRYGLAAGYAVSPIFRVLAEGFGSTKFSAKNGTNALEGIGAIQITPLQSRIAVTLGGGAGVLQGIGVPTFRGFVGFMYVHEPFDQDGDGVTDDRDQCPTIAEDRDGYQDEDGCPDPDNDNDLITDDHDSCPNVPETVNQYKDDDGCADDIPDKDKDGIADDDDKCPDTGGDVIRVKGANYGCPDTDKDGVPDKTDKCPTEKEDTDGYSDEDGCPDPDNDGDGIFDTEDQCVDVPGTPENNGCPEDDQDKDGIIDRKDKCPKQPENYNGFQDEDGCPDNRPTLVVQTADALEIKGSIEFATASDKIIGAKSFQILDAVAALMAHNGRIQKIEVSGHTDDKGSHDLNVELSRKRAASVVAYLTSKGIKPERLESAGYGPDRPLGDNKTPAGRQKNRRVEFAILKQASQ